jgi:hypothetical protein
MKTKGKGIILFLLPVLITAFISCAPIIDSIDPYDLLKPSSSGPNRPDGSLSLVSLSVYSSPYKLVYEFQEGSDWAGLEIRETYSDGSTRIETNYNTYTINGFDSSNAGEKTITVSKNGASATSVVEDSNTPSLEMELTVGSWNLTVTALADTGSGAKEIARGNAPVSVLGGMISSVTVQLGNEPGDEQGALRYSVEFPDTISEASLALVSIDGREDPEPVDLLAGSTLNGGVMTKTGVLDAAAGNYLLNIDLYGSAGNAEKTEAVHIYSNTETAGVYTFSAADFSPTVEYRTGSGQNLSDALTAIGADSIGVDFTILMGQDEPAFTPFTLDNAAYGGKRLCIRGGGYTVTLEGASTGSLFTLETGVVLVLSDITLQGRGLEFTNSGALIVVAGGDLLTHSETNITGNSFSVGGGVSVSGGTFTMSGGSIAGNSSSGGGGVYVGGGSFTMGGGFSGGDTVAVIDLSGAAADLLGKSVLLRDAGYTGTIPVDRFSLGNFISEGYINDNYGTIKTPIGGNYVIDSDGKLVNR